MSQSSYGQTDFAPASWLAMPAFPLKCLRRAVLALIALVTLAGMVVAPHAHRAEAYAGETPGAAGNKANRPNRTAVGAAAPDIVEYTVQPGDTLYGIAEKSRISVETLIWANEMESNPDMLSLGEKLVILPVDGVLHTIKPGDTLSGIAAKYKADADGIRTLPANHLEGESPLLQAGQKLIVPGGTKPKPAPKPVPVSEPIAHPAPPPANAPASTSHFVWPITGTVSQGFRPYHRAIDILSTLGAPIKACDSGYVSVAGWSSSGWGNYVVIDHGNGFRTLYAHMSRIDVKPGQAVQQNDVIGAVGATGNATAYHVHLEVYQGGAQIDPRSVLP
jgi:LysM repeat protein